MVGRKGVFSCEALLGMDGKGTGWNGDSQGIGINEASMYASGLVSVKPRFYLSSLDSPLGLFL